MFSDKRFLTADSDTNHPDEFLTQHQGFHVHSSSPIPKKHESNTFVSMKDSLMEGDSN